MVIDDRKEIIESFNELKKNLSYMKKISQSIPDSEKDSEEFKKLDEELKEINNELENLVSNEDKENLKKMNQIQSHIDHLNKIIEDPEADEEIKERAKRQIFLIQSSYTLEVFNELRPTMKPKKLVENYLKLKNKAEQKLQNNPTFVFHSPSNIEKKIKSVLPDELKSKSKLVASFIYAFITTASLKINGYAMFVYFLIRNINNLDKDFEEKDILIKNLEKLARELG